MRGKQHSSTFYFLLVIHYSKAAFFNRICYKMIMIVFSIETVLRSLLVFSIETVPKSLLVFSIETVLRS